MKLREQTFKKTAVQATAWLLICLQIFTGGVVFADDSKLTQTDLYTKLNIHYFDLQQTQENCSNTVTSVSGNGNEEKVWNYLTGHGLTPVATAGIMGNISAESGFNPSAEQNPGAWEDLSSLNVNQGGKGGVGLAQWDGGRRPAVINFLKSKGISDAALHNPSDSLISGELDYMLQELNTGYKNALDAIMKDTTPAQAAYDFHRLYEISSDSMDAIKSNRIDPAVNYYNKFKGNSSTSLGSTAITTDNGCSGASLSVDCSGANGDAKIICAAKAYDTVSYLYDAGHNGGAEWHRGCPTVGPSCSLDCSGLVNIAVYDAFGVDLQENTDSERADNKNWQKIPLSKVQPGDLIQPESGHVEVIDHVAGGRVYSFGAHTDGIPQPQQVGPASYPINSGNLYLHYIGQGSGASAL